VPIRSMLRRALCGALALAGAFLTACTFTVAQPLPSPWAVNHPDTMPVTSGRVVRFAANYGLMGPSPAVVFRDVDGQVTGQMLVWYRAFEPTDAGRRTPADSAEEWGRMQAAMAAGRARYDSLYGCTRWARGTQDGPAWVCRVPEQHGAVSWAGELKRLDSLVAARASAGPPGGRRYAPDTTRASGVAPPPPGTTRIPTGGVAGCLDGGSWSIQIKDARGTQTITAPPPTGGCPRPAGPGKIYDEAGWKMLREFIAAVK